EQSRDIDAELTSYQLDGLPDVGTCEFHLGAVNAAGVESQRSNTATKLMGIPELPGAPTSGPIITWSESPPVATVGKDTAGAAAGTSGGRTVSTADLTIADNPDRALYVWVFLADASPPTVSWVRWSGKSLTQLGTVMSLAGTKRGYLY